MRRHLMIYVEYTDLSKLSGDRQTVRPISTAPKSRYTKTEADDDEPTISLIAPRGVVSKLPYD
jgi:hypothetical protein